MAHVQGVKFIGGKTQPIKLNKPLCRDENEVKWSVEVTFKGIPIHKYDDFLDEVQSLAREWETESQVGVGEEDE